MAVIIEVARLEMVAEVEEGRIAMHTEQARRAEADHGADTERSPADGETDPTFGKCRGGEQGGGGQQSQAEHHGIPRDQRRAARFEGWNATLSIIND